MFIKNKNSYKDYRKTIPWKKVIQIGYDKKKKQPIFKELTYDLFLKNFSEEFMFDYEKGKKTISFSIGNNYEVGILDWETNCWDIKYFENMEILLYKTKINGKTIKEIWEDLEN